MNVCAMLTWACTQKTRALSSAEAELYGIGSGAMMLTVQEWLKNCDFASTRCKPTTIQQIS